MSKLDECTLEVPADVSFLPAVSASPISKKGTPAPATAGTPSTTADSPAPDGSKAAQNGSAMGTPPNLSTPINFEILNDKVRNACLKLLHQSLAVDHEGGTCASMALILPAKLADPSCAADKSIVFEAALNVESAAFKVIGKNTPSKEYSTKMRSLSLNVKDKRNPSLRKGVIDGRISPESFVVMTAEEMASDEQKQERQRLIMKNLFNARAAEEQQAETDAFECSRCRQRKCRYYQKQTRSADEPMTVFVTCTNCNYRWKFS